MSDATFEDKMQQPKLKGRALILNKSYYVPVMLVMVLIVIARA